MRFPKFQKGEALESSVIARGREEKRGPEMEAVKAFNQELSSLYELKPPISKARMTSITKSAIKAIKFYKHVVQSVEKFIQKCRPEFKIPGLYVIDSIVRQSRHQGRKRQLAFIPLDFCAVSCKILAIQDT